MNKSCTIQLHQAVHGYSDARRQFALSAPLTPRDAKTLLILSDSSGPGARFPERGYLTGYPFNGVRVLCPGSDVARAGNAATRVRLDAHLTNRLHGTCRARRCHWTKKMSL